MQQTIPSINPAGVYALAPNTSLSNSEYLFWHPYWITIRDCLLGEIMIKRGRERYLPKKSAQEEDEYQSYLNSAIFYNATKRTVDGLVGSIHSRPAMIDGFPQDKVSLDNVTIDGQSFEMFLKRISREVVSVGRFGILVDAPAEGGTPYFSGYNAENIVDWSTERYGAEEKLVMVILREFTRKKTPLWMSSDLIETYRILYIDENGIYKQRYYPEGNIEDGPFTEFTPTIQGRPLTEIPFTFVGPYDFGVDVEKPPILDIAILNIHHYNAYAQLCSGRAYTAMPVWNVFLQGGGNDNEEFILGPNVIWQLGSQDKVELKEFQGSGLKYLENGIMLLEQQIAAIGGRLSGVSRGTAAESSEAVAARERGEASFLQSIISTIGECGSRLLKTLAKWNGIEATPQVRLSSEIVDVYMDARAIRAVESLYKTGLMPVESLYAIFRDTALLRPDISLDDFREMLPKMTPSTDNKIQEYQRKAEIDHKFKMMEQEIQQRVNTQQQEETSPYGPGAPFRRGNATK